MTITCEKCSTRFVLDEARIPAKGARVRCSRCQHRFHVMPPPVRESPDEIAEKAIEDSAPFDPGVGREAREPEGDGALDNPEFIFEERVPQPAPRPSAEAAADFGEPPRAVQAAAAPLAADAADASLFGALPEGGLAADPDGQRAEDLSNAAWETTGTPAPAPSGVPIGPAADARSYEIGEPEPVAGDIDPRPQRPARRPTTAETWQGFARDEMPRHERAARVPEAAPRSAGPVLPRASKRGLLHAWIPGVAASLLSVALIAASARVLHAGWSASFSAPQDVRGAGWVATGIEAFHARGPAGEPVLVLRGALVAEGAALPPRVRALLLDAEGQPLDAGVDALLRRLDDAELADGPASAEALAGQPVRGFTAFVPVVPEAAERYRLELLPGAGS